MGRKLLGGFSRNVAHYTEKGTKAQVKHFTETGVPRLAVLKPRARLPRPIPDACLAYTGRLPRDVVQAQAAGDSSIHGAHAEKARKRNLRASVSQDRPADASGIDPRGPQVSNQSMDQQMNDRIGFKHWQLGEVGQIVRDR